MSSAASVIPFLAGSAAPSGPRALPLVTRDGAFRTPDGAIWKYRGVTAFTALNDAIHGRWEKLERYADWTRGLNGNAWRVFGSWVNLGLKPGGDAYYEALSTLGLWLNSRGIVLHFVVFCDQVDGSPVLMTEAEQDRHLYRTTEVLSGKAALGEILNEAFKNGQMAGRFPRSILTGLPWTRSTAYFEAPLEEPGEPLDWLTAHTDRDDDWSRGGKFLMEMRRGFTNDNTGYRWPGGHRPSVAGEPIRMDEATARDYADYAALAEMMGDGMCLHGGFASFDAGHATDLQNCIAPAPGSHGDRVARAVAEVWKSGIDPELAKVGMYEKGGPLVHSDVTALRTYAMTRGNQSTVVVVRPTPDHQVITRDGWRVVRRVQNVLWCER